jgi:AraC family transcriptional regulator
MALREPDGDSGNENLRGEYIARINRVMDYIENHLDESLKLDSLAGVANFSPFHFHRIFSAMTSETLSRFIQRVRIERAASQLAQNPGKTITEIALDCGFSGSAVFARTFREAFSSSASEWRKQQHKICKRESNGNQKDSKAGKASAAPSLYFDAVTHHITWRVVMNTSEIKVEVREIPEITVAYIRHIGPYQGDTALFERLFTRICSWAGPRGLFRPGETKFIVIYHDNPEITDPDKLRISVCLTVPADTVVDGEIGKMTIPAGKNAVAHFELLPHEYGEAWDAVYGGWFPRSGYQPDDRPCFELYPAESKTPEGKHIVDIYAPVKPL